MIVARARVERSRSYMSRTMARPSTSAGGFEHAADDQRWKRPSKSAKHRAGQEQAEAADQHRATAKAIG